MCGVRKRDLTFACKSEISFCVLLTEMSLCWSFDGICPPCSHATVQRIRKSPRGMARSSQTSGRDTTQGTSHLDLRGLCHKSDHNARPIGSRSQAKVLLSRMREQSIARCRQSLVAGRAPRVLRTGLAAASAPGT